MPPPEDSISRDTHGITTKVSPRSVPDTRSRLTEILASKGMQVFAVIDQQAAAHAVGLELRETILIIFGNPAAGTPVMAAAPLAALDLPLRVLIWSGDAQTRVSYLDPDAFAARYDLSPELAGGLAGIDALTDLLVSI